MVNLHFARAVLQTAYCLDDYIMMKKEDSTDWNKLSQYSDTMSFFEKILQLSDEVAWLKNFKSDVQKWFDTRNEDTKKLILLKFRKGEKIADISKILNLGSRVVKWRINLVIKSLSGFLTTIGYLDEDFYEFFNDFTEFTEAFVESKNRVENGKGIEKI